jgi:hypothetical protein
VIKVGNLIKGDNADTGFFDESNFYFLCHAPNIQQNLKYRQQIYHHIIALHSVWDKIGILNFSLRYRIEDNFGTGNYRCE